MSNLTPDDNRFAELVGGFFHQLLRAGGVSMMPTTAHERLREVGEQFARCVEAAAERKSVLVIRKLQAAVKNAFVAMEASLDSVVSRSEANRRALLGLEARIRELENTVKDPGELETDSE